MEKRIKIAGAKDLAITLNSASQTQHLRGHLKVLNELIGYLYCFISGNIYPGNLEQTTKTVGKMLENATLIDNRTKIKFNFPKKLKEQFRLENYYIISLIDNDVFSFYCNQLLPSAKLRCHIIIDASGKELQFAFRRLQRTIMNSEEHLCSVSISKTDNDYYALAKFHYDKSDDIQIGPVGTLNLAVYELQKILTPFKVEEETVDEKGNL